MTSTETVTPTVNPQDEKWLLCRLTCLPEDAENCADWLIGNGSEGVQIEDTRIKFDQSEDATLESKEEVVVTGYVRGSLEIGIELQENWLEAEIDAVLEIEPVEAKDWANEWRENFPPLEIGPFLVTPTWENLAPSQKIIIRLDPGLAFGTGQHPTTRMCLELLAQTVQSGQRVLDVGCGSGILSVAAAKLGAIVTGSDLDPWCVEATLQNAQLNEVEIEVHGDADLGWMKAPFPFVIANLMSDLLIRLAPELSRVTEIGGTLVVSGISAPRASEVESALQKAGFKSQLKREMDGETRAEGDSSWTETWAAFVFERVNLND
ncbi:ribosomal protein L11 methyltransferase [Abditibacterium utsteinense]|uniref:Ribosomal protein L11 methyltransferase n=1 Tax=Abditibacterium utsteinense TaxID=1960156 RepID=A0A2S8SPC0_9BACT|nr:50S ribosomal protein L11 methyltransferase [Abditibacterium utsteinense]PQV62638.1 ribosomal protein L11 methyltransferase [Abditibacterium utsteinense]